MGTIIASLVGLFGAALPKVFEVFQDGKDKKHELEIIRLQIQRDKELGTQNAQAIELQSDSQVRVEAIKAGRDEIKNPYIAALRDSVRPTITYLLVARYMYVVLAGNYAWTAFDSDLLALILGFWFGGRIMQRK